MKLPAIAALIANRGAAKWFPAALLALGLACFPAQAAETVETRLDRVETRLDGVETRLDNVEMRLDRVETVLVQLQAQITVLSGKVDTLTWALFAGFGFLGLVILFKREQPQAPADQRALKEIVDQAVQQALAQRGAGAKQ